MLAARQKMATALAGWDIRSANTWRLMMLLLLLLLLLGRDDPCCWVTGILPVLFDLSLTQYLSFTSNFKSEELNFVY